MIIAIDGPSASGKSTVAKLVAKKLGLNYLDTGAMYRAVTLAYIQSSSARQSGSNQVDFTVLLSLLPNIEISFINERVLLNQEDVTNEIRSSEVSNNVSAVAAIKEVRDKLVAEQRRIGSKGNVVLDGRDIGTVVFPTANVKVFLVASPEVRAKRRMKDLEVLGEEKDLATLTEEIRKRDEFDSHRVESPLKRAEDAVEINTDEMTVDEVVEKICELAK